MNPDDIKSIQQHAEDLMKKAIDHLEVELVKIRAGKANPQMVDGITVDYYGSPMPLEPGIKYKCNGCPYTFHTTLGKKYAAAY